ncbi:hypothetical protein PTKIN_Ptkin11bG0183300 [Pterospermum kingtungense]
MSSEVTNLDWGKLFSLTVDQEMEFFEPKSVEGSVHAVLPDEVIDEGEKNWLNAIVVQVAGHIPNFNSFQKQANLLWGKEGNVESLIIHKWEEGMDSLEFNMARLPVWVHLDNVPLEAFTEKGLSYIASVLGKPLYMDRYTTQTERLSYARVCVELDAVKDIPYAIEVELRKGRTVWVQVSIPWMSPKCSKCKIFGHVEKNFPRNWVKFKFGSLKRKRRLW